MEHEALKEKVIEHSFRLDSNERLAEQHNKEIGALRMATNQLRLDLNDAMSGLRAELKTSVNKMIIAAGLIVLLGENALPVILKMVGI